MKPSGAQIPAAPSGNQFPSCLLGQGKPRQAVDIEGKWGAQSRVRALKWEPRDELGSGDLWW